MSDSIGDFTRKLNDALTNEVNNNFNGCTNMKQVEHNLLSNKVLRNLQGIISHCGAMADEINKYRDYGYLPNSVKTYLLKFIKEEVNKLEKLINPEL